MKKLKLKLQEYLKIYNQLILFTVLYYFLVLIVGGGQFIWSLKYDAQQSIDMLFYMSVRSIMTISIITLFFRKSQWSIYWFMVIESAINLNYILRNMCFYTSNLFVAIAKDNVATYIENVRFWIAWDSFLGLISITIIWYIISCWNFLKNEENI